MQKIKYFCFLLIILSGSVCAQIWQPIIPMPYCPTFQVEFKYEGSYQIRYKEFPEDSQFQYITENLDDINNLSILTDRLQAIANNYCSQTYTVTYRDDQILCMRDLGAEPFSSEYVNFLENLITVVDNSRRNCEDVIPLIELQNHITNLSREGLLNFGRYRNLFKLFVGSDSDRMIDHFYECGGSNGTPKFIENIILLEAQNACLFPAPPGMLDFETTQLIARQIADDYPNMSLLSLNSKQDEITKKAVMSFTRTIFDKNIKDFLGEETDTTQIINDLSTYQNLRGEKDKRVFDHLTYITAVEAPIEIIDQVFPRIIHDSLSPILPDSMNEAEKNNYINENFKPQILANYNQCIASARARINSSRGRNSKGTIRNRQAIEAQYCETNPASCEANACDRKVNFLTERSDISDIDIVESCVFTSFQDKIDDIISLILDDQRQMLSDSFSLSDQQFDNIKSQSATEMRVCLDRNVKRHANQDYDEPLAVNPEAYFHIDANQFKTILDNCAKRLDENLTSDFASLIISNMDLVTQNFGNSETTTVRGIPVNTGSLEFARSIVNGVVTDCNLAQSFRVYNSPDLSQSTTNCTSLIEMSAAGSLVDTLITDMLVEHNVPSSNTNSILLDFQQCRERATSNARAAILNPNHEHAIMDSNSSDSYLQNNHEFFYCTRDAILESVDSIADAQIDSTIEELGSQLSDKAYFESLKDQIKLEINQCFEGEMNRISSWPDFMQSNEDGRFNTIIQDCTNRGIEFTLPLVIANETSLQVQALEGVSLIDQFQNEEILSQIASTLALNYNIQDAANKSSDTIIREAFQRYRVQNPNSSDLISNFTQEYIQTAQLTTVDNLAGSILDQVIESSKPGFNFDELREVVTPQCLDQFYDQNKTNIEHLVNLSRENPSSGTMNLKSTFVTILRNGLIHSTLKGRLTSLFERLRIVCQNPQNYQNLSSLVELGIGDDIIMAEVANQARLSFTVSITDQCLEGLSLYKPHIRQSEIEILCSNPTQNKGELLNTLSRRINDPSVSNLIRIFETRYRESLRLVRAQFSNKTKVDQIFEQNPQLLEYIYANFDKVVTSDPVTKQQLSLNLMDALFSDMSTNSFATNFTEVQIIAGVAHAGYPVARHRLEETINNLNIARERARPLAIEEFHQRWTYGGISHYLDLDEVSDQDRQNIFNTVYQNSIRPRIDSSVTNASRAQRETVTSTALTQFLDTNRQHPNPEYRPARTIYSLAGPVYIAERGPTHLNFSEKLSQDITDETTSRVWGSIRSDVGDFFNIFD